MSFEPGDVVQLKSGGPLMTVDKVGTTVMLEEEAVWCIWFEKVGNRQVRQENTFPPKALEKVERTPMSGSVIRG